MLSEIKDSNIKPNYFRLFYYPVFQKMFGFEIRNTKDYIIKQFKVVKKEFNDDLLHCPLYLHIDLFNQVSEEKLFSLLQATFGKDCNKDELKRG